jgi:hypothetical protein
MEWNITREFPDEAKIRLRTYREEQEKESHHRSRAEEVAGPEVVPSSLRPIVAIENF